MGTVEPGELIDTVRFSLHCGAREPTAIAACCGFQPIIGRFLSKLFRVFPFLFRASSSFLTRPVSQNTRIPLHFHIRAHTHPLHFTTVQRTRIGHRTISGLRRKCSDEHRRHEKMNATMSHQVIVHINTALMRSHTLHATSQNSRIRATTGLESPRREDILQSDSAPAGL